MAIAAIPPETESPTMDPVLRPLLSSSLLELLLLLEPSVWEGVADGVGVYAMKLVTTCPAASVVATADVCTASWVGDVDVGWASALV